MRPRHTHPLRPPLAARVVLFGVVTLLLALGLISSKVPPVVVMALVTWAVLALCTSACDSSELAGRLRQVVAELEDARRSLDRLRQEKERLGRDLAAAREGSGELDTYECLVACAAPILAAPRG